MRVRFFAAFRLERRVDDAAVARVPELFVPAVLRLPLLDLVDLTLLLLLDDVILLAFLAAARRRCAVLRAA